MNNDLQYGLKGILLTILFFAVLKSVFYLFSYSQRITEEPSTGIVIYNTEPSHENIDPQYLKGKVLFAQNCASCHAIYKNLTGPALAGIEDRVPDKKILYAWIKNNEKVLKSGNKYFTTLYESYNKTPMNSFPSLTDADIEAILFYIREYKNNQSPLPIAAAY